MEVDFGGQLGYDRRAPEHDPDHLERRHDADLGRFLDRERHSLDGRRTRLEIGQRAVGDGARHAGSSFARTSDFLVNPFGKELQLSGDEANEYGYITSIELEPGQTKSLVHFVVAGLSETTKTPGRNRDPGRRQPEAAVKTKPNSSPRRRIWAASPRASSARSTTGGKPRSRRSKPSFSGSECTPKMAIGAPRQ